METMAQKFQKLVVKEDDIVNFDAWEAAVSKVHIIGRTGDGGNRDELKFSDKSTLAFIKHEGVWRLEVNRIEYPYEAKTNNKDERIYYSELQVLQSGAGYYIGRMGWAVDKKLGGYQEPYSRESEYYPTSESAEKVLKSGMFDRHSGVENDFAKSVGNLPSREVTSEVKEQGMLFAKAIYRNYKMVGPIKTHNQLDMISVILERHPGWTEADFLDYMVQFTKETT